MLGRRISNAIGLTAWRQRRRQRRIDLIRTVMERELFDVANIIPLDDPAARSAQLRQAAAAMRLSVKALGTQLAAQHYGSVAAGRKPVLSDRFVPRWQPTRFNDFVQAWFIDTCNTLRLAPLLHRKLWEEAYIVNTLMHAGKLGAGSRGIVFGVGEERLPAFFASQGAAVLATDLAPDRPGASDWIGSAQHGSLEHLFHGQYVQRDVFDRLITFRYADMNDIPAELDGQFDFCWSTCAFEHLGSIEQGLRFVERSGRLLKPGGVAVHTSEFNYTSNDRTVDHRPTVLFRRRDYEDLATRLRGAGYELPPIDFDTGTTPVDAFVDLPPYFPIDGQYFHDGLDPLHLKLLIEGFPSTCYGVSFRRPADAPVKLPAS